MSYRASYRLLDPKRGTKLVIEGPYAKSGKTLLGVYLLLMKLDQNPEMRGYGNFPIKHKQYKFKKKLTPADFDPDTEYIVLLDEVDVKYPYQKSYWNEGLLAFWGFGASHSKCAVIVTVQREYSELKNKFLRQFHIKLERCIINSITDLPFAVAFQFIFPNLGVYTQNIEYALNKYDPYERQVVRIDFAGFCPEVLERKESIQKNSTTTSTVSTLHGGQLRAVKKALKELVSVHGNISNAARKTGIGRGFFYDIMGRKA